MKKYLLPGWKILASCLLILAWTVTSCNSVQGQSREPIYHLSYFGNNLVHGGLKVGMEFPKRSFEQITRTGKTRTIRNSYRADLGCYHHNNNHLGLFVNAGWQRTKIFSNRFFWTVSANPLGLYRSFLPKTYRVDEEGNVQRVFLPGRVYLAPSVSAGIGRVGKRHPERGWFVKGTVITLLPYNTYLMPLLNVEFGYHFSFQSTNK